ncbi:MAG: flagellar type III secretion system pore protein FliP [Bacillota bacterium]|jgi:flagellar biosynthetic protein FliP
MKRGLLFLILVIALILLLPSSAWATSGDIFPSVSLNIGGGEGGSDSIRLLMMVTVLALAPSILIMMTSFTRIIIVLSFIRNALGLQQTPPNQVLIGLALFLSLFIMSPVIEEINKEAYIPYTQGVIDQREAIEKATVPLREFMMKQTNNNDLKLFLNLSHEEQPQSLDEIKMRVIIPAFITSELKRAFTIGFMIFLPFIVIDMVVASVLMSMGMMMVPPVMISLPFKIMLFVLVDGWGLTIKSLIMSFN